MVRIGIVTVLCKRALHSRSASVFVIKPHVGAVLGKMLWFFNTFNCSGVHCEQYICNWSHSWWIWLRRKSLSTEFKTCGKHRRFSPPTTKHDIFSPSKIVSVLSLQLVSAVVRIGGNCCIGKGGCCKKSSSFESGDNDSHLTLLINDKPGPWRLLVALCW